MITKSKNQQEAELALSVDNLSKKYQKEQVTNSFRQAIANYFRPKQPISYIWALQELSFTVKKGQIIGIIGKNGSGKSTLLKVLSGITKPTSGEVTIYGEVASILDIGAGFHPDLTGRENIYLKGQLHGLSKKEISQKFVEIVDFSGIEQYIDMPVKFYSNGMFLRLAFSFLTHLEVSIFLFDEVLAVGDVGFQQKCIQKIQEIARSGKTILFVSHSTQDLLNICDAFLQLENGRLVDFDKGAKVLINYMEATVGEETSEQSKSSLKNRREWSSAEEAPGDETFHFKYLEIKPEGSEGFYPSSQLTFEACIDKSENEGCLDIAFTIADNLGHLFMACFPHKVKKYFEEEKCGKYFVRCTIPARWLNSGTFFINVYVIKDREEIQYTFKQAIGFELLKDEKPSIISPNLQIPTPMTPALDWQLWTAF